MDYQNIFLSYSISFLERDYHNNLIIEYSNLSSDWDLIREIQIRIPEDLIFLDYDSQKSFSPTEELPI